MTKDQRSVIIGSLLGDGHISPILYRNTYFSKKQTRRRREYLEWHFKMLSPYSSRLFDVQQPLGDKVFELSIFRTHFDPVFTKLRKVWYPDWEKRLPVRLKLDGLSIAIWYCDDGYNDVSRRTVKFAAQSFTMKECQRLSRELGKFGIEANVTKNREIRIRTSSYLRFVKLVTPYVRRWSCFKYKIDLSSYRSPIKTDLSAAEKKEICARYLKGEQAISIARKLSRSVSAVSGCLRSRFARHGVSLSNKSGTAGVGWESDRGKWSALGYVDGVYKRIGRFATKEEAMHARSRCWPK